MLVAERYDKIVQLVNDRGGIRVTELSELCRVTEETIRRDLARLEAAGLLRRSHGGAIPAKTSAQPEVPHAEREILHSEEKRRIAEEAIRHISPNDRILLDASTTAWYMARSLPDIPLTVLTNSIKVAFELAAKERIDVISIGGLLAQRSLSFVGPQAERVLDEYHVDKMFFSCKGVHPERGVSESNELQARIKQKMMERADKAILLADASKFGVQAFSRVAEWHQIEAVITDRRLSSDIYSRMEMRRVSLQLV